MAKKNRALRGDDFTKREMWWYYVLVYGLIWVYVAYNLVWGILSIFDMPMMYLLNDIDGSKLNVVLEDLRAQPEMLEIGIPNLRTFNIIIGIVGVLIACYTALTGYMMLKFKKHAVGLLCVAFGINMGLNGVILPIYYQVNIAETHTLAALQTAGALVGSPSTLMNFLLGWNLILADMITTLFFFADKNKLFKNAWFEKQ